MTKLKKHFIKSIFHIMISHLRIVSPSYLYRRTDIIRNSTLTKSENDTQVMRVNLLVEIFLFQNKSLSLQLN